MPWPEQTASRSGACSVQAVGGRAETRPRASRPWRSAPSPVSGQAGPAPGRLQGAPTAHGMTRPSGRAEAGLLPCVRAGGTGHVARRPQASHRTCRETGHAPGRWPQQGGAGAHHAAVLGRRARADGPWMAAMDGCAGLLHGPAAQRSAPGYCGAERTGGLSPGCCSPAGLASGAPAEDAPTTCRSAASRSLSFTGLRSRTARSRSAR